MNLCLTIARGRDKEKASAFVCIGLLTVACRPASLSAVPKILEAVRAALPTKVSLVVAAAAACWIPAGPSRAT